MQVNKYVITLSDNGKLQFITTTSTNVEQAIKQCLQGTFAPDSSIKAAYQINDAGFLVHATGEKVGDIVRVNPPKEEIKKQPCAGNPYATGYGEKIPTDYMVKGNKGKWLRVYCRCFSNSGTLWVKHPSGYRVIVDLDNYQG